MKTAKNSSPLVGQKIRTARKAVGLTLADLSQQIGISIQALSAIERGVANPSRQTMIGLARVLENDFGDADLKRYATGARKLTHSQVLDKIIKERYPAESRPPEFNPYLENILEWSYEAQEAANLPQPVVIFNQKSALMPIHYEIVNGDILRTNEDSYKVAVPYSLITSVGKARCVRVQDKPLRDAFLSPGDVLVLCESLVPEQGKIVLALVNDNVVIRRWELRGRDVMFTALDQSYEPIVVPRKKVKFIGELRGVLRLISTTPVPHFK